MSVNNPYKNKLINNYSTRRKRQAALLSIIGSLGQIALAEESYRDNMPLNPQSFDAYDAASYYICLLDDAIDDLRSVYDYIYAR